MAIYKRGREFELGTTEHKSSKWLERDSNPGPPDCADHSATLPPLNRLHARYCVISNNQQKDWFVLLNIVMLYTIQRNHWGIKKQYLDVSLQ